MQLERLTENLFRSVTLKSCAPTHLIARPASSIPSLVLTVVMTTPSSHVRAALCCLLLAALAASAATADQQQWRRLLAVSRSVDAFHGPLRRLEPLIEDAAQQDSRVASPAGDATEKAAAGSVEHPVVLTVVGALLAVGFLVGVAMVLRRSHGRSEETRGIRLGSRLIDEDEEAGLGLMASDEHAEDEFAEEDDEWEEKEEVATVDVEDKSD